MMRIDYDVTGPSRRKLVEAISRSTGYEAEYLRLPTYGYKIGPYTVSRDGIVEVDEDEPTLDAAINGAVLAGFIGNFMADPEEEDAIASEDDIEQMPSISITKSGMTPVMVENLKKIIEAKAELIKKAFGTDTLAMKEDALQITFEWFPGMGIENAPAYTEFVSRLRTMAMESKRITMKSKPVENEKYAWRCFLLRLGLIGPEYKEIRKTLMKNFEGSSAFKGKRAKDGGK